MHNPEGIFFLIYYILTLGLKIIFDLFLSLIVFFFLLFWTVNLNFTVRLQDADIFHGVYLTTGLNKEMSVQHVEDTLTMTARDKSCSSSYVLVVDVSTWIP